LGWLDGWLGQDDESRASVLDSVSFAAAVVFVWLADSSVVADTTTTSSAVDSLLVINDSAWTSAARSVVCVGGGGHEAAALAEGVSPLSEAVTGTVTGKR
jgi:hypothetical protein